MLDNKKIKKILIVRLSSIGDVILALPVAHVIRKELPDVEISWIVENKSKDVLLGNPNLDQLILLPKKKWQKEFKINKWKTLKEIKGFFTKLSSNNFDLVIDIQGLFKSGLISFLSKAQKRLGSANGREMSFLFYNQKVKLPKKMHVIKKNLCFAKAIGAKSDEVGFDVLISPQEKKKIDELFAEIFDFQSKEIITINPFTSWTSKNWLKERYARLADRIIKELGVEVIFTGSSADRKGIAGILTMMEEKAHNLAGRTNLKELAELYRRSEIFIGGDTGPMHLAVAMKVPVIAIMGPTDPVTNGPYGEGNIVIQKELACINCWQHECDRDHLCMKAIGVKDVFQAVLKLWRGKGND